MQTQKNDLVKQQHAVQQALTRENAYQEKQEVLGLRAKKEQMQNEITQAVNEQRWDDAVKAFGAWITLSLLRKINWRWQTNTTCRPRRI
ncbi:MAG: hypothetical protein R3F37_03570 [Candidatus Competibacteraceae bacterium]